jgi:non-specific serine/threonine protein kinase
MLQDGAAAEAAQTLRDGMCIFDELPERWGLLYGACLLATASAALGDWPRAAIVLGVHDTLSERSGGQPFPQILAAITEIWDRAVRVLGPGADASREVGRVIGRADGITAALWPAPDELPAPPAPFSPLTTREREVAELIAEGLTNRQIGGRLFIAERTVDTHVGRILAKLGCSSRAQVAATIVAARTIAAPSADTYR